MGSTGVSPIHQHEVDQPAMLVDGLEQVLPVATDLDCVNLGIGSEVASSNLVVPTISFQLLAFKRDQNLRVFIYFAGAERNVSPRDPRSTF